MPSVLFICTGNQFRSPIAEAVFRDQLARDHRRGWTVSSAGTWTTPGQPVFRETVELARLMGLDLASHRTRLVDASMLEQADLVLVMESGHKEALGVEFPATRQKVHLLAEVLTGAPYDIPDPAGNRTESGVILRNLADLIRKNKEKIYSLAGQ